MRNLTINTLDYDAYNNDHLYDGEMVYHIATNMGDVLVIREAGEGRCDFENDVHDAIPNAAFYAIEDVTGIFEEE
jgi:hypothetical protein